MAFELVSKDTFNDFLTKQGIPTDTEVVRKHPIRSTYRSAGYDFFIPYDLDVKAGERVVVGTGIKWNPNVAMVKQRGINNASGFLDEIKTKDLSANAFLALYPRSSLGFKYGFTLLNTTGIIDADYYNNPDNEGHIMVGFTTTKDLHLNAGDKLCQGIIQLFGVDKFEATPMSERSGGIGSTGVK